MNVDIGTEVAHFLSLEYLFRIFGIVSLQCIGGNHKKHIFAKRVSSETALSRPSIFEISIHLKFIYITMNIPWGWERG